MSEARRRLDSWEQHRDPDFLLTTLQNHEPPKGWEVMSNSAKLDYVATRLLAEDRQGTTSHEDLKQTGILSESQYERRLAREVYSNKGSLNEVPPKHGVFSRPYRKVNDPRKRKTNEQ